MSDVQFDGRAWGTIGERGNLLAGEGWRYLPSGGVRHLTTSKFTSACGVDAEEAYWRGTGSQEEYERLGSMPKCLKCMRHEARRRDNRARLVRPVEAESS